MAQKKILYITQEIYPYLEESTISNISRYLPQAIQERGREIRTFMPKYGTINERRNQLHEVIRLSGMNLIIDDSDHSLIIKVASIQAARMQVYFIDNEDFFQQKELFVDANGEEYDDNGERSIFFVRGVMETIKKLRWIPDIIHCHGWFTALAPLYIKRGYADDPCFSNAKVVYSVYDDVFTKSFHDSFADKLRFDTIGDSEIDLVKARGEMDFVNLTKLAVDYSDGVIQGVPAIDKRIKAYVKEKQIPFLPYKADFDQSVEEIDAFYDKIG
ncbi:MAG TPA: glycogen synthase [Porphyromonadaceae bacterium]|jgi:starch synthase|uniref:glycogen/starch synthase n=1 Tax=Limibacterium fermenti TaxID=3229863 RepID=UPI000E9A10D3|nr:glycogen synthase [Porphyromonadaceae bacterium]HBL33717.1 glycogen synthase [Porphyromonadaceae bacterium]HBX20569.1 glycogen synthase [Porphyromonadaceae bacterium]HBX45175.1 glycogen synthase [Porphyromonadaceae bacterium]HCM22040.1 glycogen synthase [Porphyromonadaceae bacterium]